MFFWKSYVDNIFRNESKFVENSYLKCKINKLRNNYFIYTLFFFLFSLCLTGLLLFKPLSFIMIQSLTLLQSHNSDLKIKLQMDAMHPSSKKNEKRRFIVFQDLYFICFYENVPFFTPTFTESRPLLPSIPAGDRNKYLFFPQFPSCRDVLTFLQFIFETRWEKYSSYGVLIWYIFMLFWHELSLMSF